MVPVSSLDCAADAWNPSMNSTDIAEALNDTTILITGAAGFVGVALVQRLLLDPQFEGINQVICIIRGDSVESATLRLPESLQRLAKSTSEKNDNQATPPRLIVLNGDCSRPDFGLQGDQLNAAMKANIVIHAAGDTRFTLPLKDAMASISDLAYMTSRFSLLSYRAKTHIHISTTFVAWFLPDGTVVREDLIQRGPFSTPPNEDHVNTYFHAKTIAEGCVNAIFTPQTGRALHGKAARILRLSTIGPSITYPRPAWGAGHPSSPLCAAIAAVPLSSLDHLADGAFLDVIPVDIAVNQIVAITAATHRTHKLPTDNPAHPRNSSNPVNQDGNNIPVYNIASGLAGPNNIQIATLNEKALKIEEPYIPEKNLMKVYKPFMIKKLDFATKRAAKVLQIRLAGDDQSLAQMASEKLGMLTKESSNGTHVVDAATAPSQSSSTAKNVEPEWSDPSINCGHLQVDVGQAIGLQEYIDKGESQLAWHKYIACIRDEMEARGPRAEWTSFVD